MCGIVGYLSEKNTVDIQRIKLLMIELADRGKHSVGIVNELDINKIMGDVEDFVTQNDWNRFKNSKILLAHNRAPSAGTVRSLEGAQPYYFSSKAHAGGISIVHNGTIRNATDLKKNNSDIVFDANDTDTQVLAKIIHKHVIIEKNKDPYDVLSTIEGTATIMWFFDNDQSSMYVFKSMNDNEKRPLYSLCLDQSVYFASTEQALKLIANSPDEATSIKEIDVNKVFKYSSKDISNPEVVAEITFPEKPPVVTHNTWSNNYNTTDDSRTNTGSLSELLKIDRVFQHTSHHSNAMPVFNLVKGDADIFTEKLIVGYLTRNKLVFYKGKYLLNSQPLNGIYKFDADWEVDDKFNPGNEYAFTRGILLRNVTDYNYVDVRIKSLAGEKVFFGSLAFYNVIKQYTNQFLPVVEKNGVGFYAPNGSATFVYKPIGTNSMNYEFMMSVLIAKYKYKLSEINEDDRIALDNNTTAKVVVRKESTLLVCIEGTGLYKDINEERVVDILYRANESDSDSDAEAVANHMSDEEVTIYLKEMDDHFDELMDQLSDSGMVFEEYKKYLVNTDRVDQITNILENTIKTLKEL